MQLNLILGSGSPRRRELLAALDLPFTAITIDSDETWPEGLSGGDIALHIAKGKAEAWRPNLKENDLLLTADTIVWVCGQVLGKPHDPQEAATMLRLLSGRTHQVYTGVCLTSCNRQMAFVDTTDVTFRPLTDEEIAYYIRIYKPFDKAGAYGIQEWIGHTACTALHGSYFNVMGLPTHRISEALQSFTRWLPPTAFLPQTTKAEPSLP